MRPKSVSMKFNHRHEFVSLFMKPMMGYYYYSFLVQFRSDKNKKNVIISRTTRTTVRHYFTFFYLKTIKNTIHSRISLGFQSPLKYKSKRQTQQLIDTVFIFLAFVVIRIVTKKSYYNAQRSSILEFSSALRLSRFQ
jgi:hypothetical protein